jgi:gamma-glutamyltranspeptidase / glutathione hydrolase
MPAGDPRYFVRSEKRLVQGSKPTMTTTTASLTLPGVPALEAASGRGVVSAGHPAEAAAGLEMLEEGGNAIDAIVAAAFTAFVVEPAMCGLGGYGRLAVFDAASKRLVSVDHYLRAPGAARPDMFEIDEAKPLKHYETPYTKGLKAERGGLASAVPGAVAGLYWAQRRLGKLPWARVLEPAIAEAKAGLEVTWSLLLRLAENFEGVRSMPELAALFLPGGQLPRAPAQHAPGDRLPMAGLAKTLARIAEEGAAGFYSGPVAQAIARASRAAGGILTEADLAAYRPRILYERPQRYRGLDYVTCFDPVGYEALNILDRFDLAGFGPDSLEYRHFVAEAMAAAFVDNIAYYGDPDFVPDSPVAGLSSPELGEKRAAMLSRERALPRPVPPIDRSAFGPGAAEREALGRFESAEPWPPKLGGTTQMATADRDGNMASLLTSVSGSFGSMIAVPETGIILNNGMGNYDPRPGRPNSIAPGKMPIFAVPTMVALEGDRAVFAAAGAGGYRITAGVLLTFLNWHDFGMGLGAAMAAPRLHCQGKETFVDPRMPQAIRDGLARLGHRVVMQGDDPGMNAYGRVSAVAFDAKSGRLQAAAGPSWHGSTGGL